MDEKQCPQGNQFKKIIAATAVSNVQLGNSFKESLHSLLQHESPYAEVLQELQSDTKQVVPNSLVFKRMHGILYVHDQSQDSDLDSWRIIVPENEVVKTQVVHAALPTTVRVDCLQRSDLASVGVAHGLFV